MVATPTIQWRGVINRRIRLQRSILWRDRDLHLQLPRLPRTRLFHSRIAALNDRRRLYADGGESDTREQHEYGQHPESGIRTGSVRISRWIHCRKRIADI